MKFTGSFTTTLCKRLVDLMVSTLVTCRLCIERSSYALSLSTQEFKWIPANFSRNVDLAWDGGGGGGGGGVTSNGLATHPGQVMILLIMSLHSTENLTTTLYRYMIQLKMYNFPQHRNEYCKLYCIHVTAPLHLYIYMYLFL